MALGHAGALSVGLLLVLFVVTVVGVYEVTEFANLALEVVEAFLGVI